MSSIEQFNIPSKLEAISNNGAPLDVQHMNEAVDSFGMETKEFGIEECKDSAQRIFTPEVMENWGQMSPEQRQKLAAEYADSVAKNFQLVDYKGLSVEQMEGKNGYNRGDGIVHLSDHLIQSQSSPLQVVDTITHELRHQYQIESIAGHHNVRMQDWKPTPLKHPGLRILSDINIIRWKRMHAMPEPLWLRLWQKIT